MNYNPRFDKFISRLLICLSVFLAIMFIYNGIQHNQNINKKCPMTYDAGDIITHKTGVTAIIIECEYLRQVSVDTGHIIRIWKWDMIQEFNQ